MTEKQNGEVKLQLHKEKLQINKERVETAEVTVHKNTYTEEKQILVPVTREELVIEKKTINPNGAVDPQIETIRIPISEDRIEVTLHPTDLENIDIYKKQCEEILQVNETVKEEKLHIETIGDVSVREEDQS